MLMLINIRFIHLGFFSFVLYQSSNVSKEKKSSAETFRSMVSIIHDINKRNFTSIFYFKMQFTSHKAKLLMFLSIK